MVRYCTLEEEAAAERAKRGVMRQALAAEDTSVNASLYILLRAVDRFEATCGRFPGTLDGCAVPHTVTCPSTGLLSYTSETAGQQSKGSRGHPYLAEVLPFRLMLLKPCELILCADPVMQSRGPGNAMLPSGLKEISMPPPLALRLLYRLQNMQAAGGGHSSAQAAHGQCCSRHRRARISSAR